MTTRLTWYRLRAAAVGVTAFALFGCAPNATGDKAAQPPCALKAPLLGFSAGAQYDAPRFAARTFTESVARAANDVLALGAGWYRPHPSWKDIEPFVDSKNRTLAKITDAMVEEYAFHDTRLDWRKADAVIDGFTSRGVNLVVVLAGGYVDHQPQWIDGNGDSQLFLPDTNGYETFLAAVSLHVRGMVRRYRDRVHIWQIENELNVACETVLWGWRRGEGWCDAAFRTRLMQTLSAAVHAEDPRACTTHNFHTDLHWINEVTEWLPTLDIVGLDAYPNYLAGDPERGSSVGERVERTVKVAQGKPVIVLESGYPTQPASLGFTEARQADYIRNAFSSIFAAGGRGYFYFTMASPETAPVEGLQAVEPYWGLFRLDGTPKAGWQAYRDAAAAVH